MKKIQEKVISSEEQSAEEMLQFVTFRIAEETYGVSVHKVQSINEMLDITHVPGSSQSLEGVVNLRGSIVAVINMRKKFNIPFKDYDQFTVILIVEVRDRLVGMIVDSVSDVISIPASGVQKDIQFAARVDAESIEGIGRLGEDLVILLDVDSFFQNTRETG